MKPLIEVQNLRLDYPFRNQESDSVAKIINRELSRWWRNQPRPYHRALDQINLEVRPGDRLGVIGANGSGKTSLLKIISGILQPTSGQVTLRGRVLPLIDIDAGCCPELTGRENLILMGLLLGETRKNVESRIEDLIFLAGLQDFVDVPVRDYSTGMRGRLAFALISSLNAEILVFDEMLATTDASFMNLAGQRLNNMISSAGCALIVSHTMTFIEEVCNRVVWIHQGRVRAVGPAKELAREYYQWSLQAPNHVKRISDQTAQLDL